MNTTTNQNIYKNEKQELTNYNNNLFKTRNSFINIIQ